VSQTVDRDAFLFERRTNVGGDAAMFVEQVLNTMNAESAASSVGKQDITVAPLRLAQPGSEYGPSGFGERRTSLPTSLAEDPQVGTAPKDEILALEPGHLGEAKADLRGRQNKGMITPTGPGAPIGCGIVEKIIDERDIVDDAGLRQGAVLAQIPLVGPRTALGGNRWQRRALLLWNHSLGSQKRHQMIERRRIACGGLPITIATAQILRGMLRADAARSHTPLLEPMTETGGEHQLSSQIATFIPLSTQRLRKRKEMRCDGTA
jgi:hypothetical protein